MALVGRGVEALPLVDDVKVEEEGVEKARAAAEVALGVDAVSDGAASIPAPF